MNAKRDKKIGPLLRYGSGDIAWKIANIVVLSAAARLLPENKAAILVLAQTACMILMSLGDLGFRAIGIRLLARAEGRVEQLVLLVTKRRLLSMLLFGLPGATIAAAFLADDLSAFLSLLLVALAYTPYFLASDWALIALQKVNAVTLSRIVFSALLMVFVLLAYLFEGGLGFFIAGYLVSYAVFAMVSGVLVFRDIPASTATERRGRPSFLKALRSVNAVEGPAELLWSSSVVVAIAFALNALFHSIEILMIGRFVGGQDAAAFAAAFRLLFSLFSIVWMVTQYLSPVLARISRDRAGDEGRAIVNYGIGFAALGGCLAVLVAVVSDQLIWLIYGGAFEAAGAIMRQLAFSMPLDAVVAYLGTLLIMRGQGRDASISLAAGCLVSIAAFLLGRIHWDMSTGAAILAKYGGYTATFMAQCWFIARSVGRLDPAYKISERH